MAKCKALTGSAVKGLIIGLFSDPVSASVHGDRSYIQLYVSLIRLLLLARGGWEQGQTVSLYLAKENRHEVLWYHKHHDYR